MSPFQVHAALAFALGVASAQAVVVSPDPKATYLRTSENTVTPGALVLRLSDLGFAPGDRLRFEVLGDIDNGPGGDTFTFSLGLFSSSNTLLGQTVLNRVPGALASDGPAVVTSPTFFNGLATDIAQDFGFDVPDGAVVTVPAGAVYLFLAKSDSLYQDNSDPDHDYGIRITPVPVPEPAAALTLAAGLALLGLRRRRPQPRR